MKKIKITTDDRPGDQNTEYEEIETGRIAKITQYFDKYKTLLMTSSDGKSVNITYGTFKRQWREKI